MKCAVYARYSSDRQSKSSITDQVRKCQEHANARGWEVLPQHVYSDEAISGATSERAGLKALMKAASEKKFDIVLIDDTSRLSRKLADSINLSDRLKFAGVRIVFVSQGIDSDSEQSEVLMATHGIVDSLYIRELGKKTHRGLEGKVLKHLHHGGRVFGYKSVPILDSEKCDQYGRPTIAGARLAVDEAQAKTVRKIFTLYAAGRSIKSVTKKLNAERVKSSVPRKGREQSWAPSSVRVILRNERYRGILTWSKTKKVYNPQSGKRVRRARPQSEWVTVPMPEQRIIPEPLWRAVETRRAFVDRIYGARGRKGGLMNLSAATSKYIFSGLLKCGVCGANYVIVSGKGKHHKSSTYGCPSRAFRGTCENARRVERVVLEKELLTKLQRDVLSDAAIEYVLERFEQELQKRVAALDGRMDEMQQRKKVLEGKVKNLARFFEDGSDSPTLRASMATHEAEIASITAKTLGTKKDSIRREITGLRKFVMERMGHIRPLLAGRKHGNSLRVKQELAKYIGGITLLPEGKEIRYKGNWKLLGPGDTGGAEGQS